MRDNEALGSSPSKEGRKSMKNFVRASLAALALSVAIVPVAVRAQNITTIAGGGPPASGTAVAKTAASIGAPAAVRQDSLGNTYILDNDFSRVYKVDTTGHLTVFAGNGSVGFSGEGGPAVNAAMFEPSGMCIDASNNVYVADSDNAIIREIVVSNRNGGTDRRPHLHGRRRGNRNQLYLRRRRRTGHGCQFALSGWMLFR